MEKELVGFSKADREGGCPECPTERWEPEGVCVLVSISGLLGVSTKGVFVWRVFFVGVQRSG